MLHDDPRPPLPVDATRVLLAGDASSVDDLATALSVLPICARGQVFVEVDDASQVRPLEAPGRVTVTWLRRDVRSGAPGSCTSCAPGEALGRAVRAWLAEMHVDGDALRATEHLVWLAGPESYAWELRHDLRASLPTASTSRETSGLG